jgi:hypothetical protein
MKYKHEQLKFEPDKEHNLKKNVQKDCIALCEEKVFYPIPSFEKGSLHKLEKIFHRVPSFEKGSLPKVEKEFHRNHAFDMEMFQWADYEFVNWANSMKETMLMAVMAELKQAPKMKPSIEALRPRVSKIPCCSIEEYRKKRCLGERSVDFLKQLNVRYGKNLLRVLYLTSDPIS